MPAVTAYGYVLECCLGIGRQAQAGRWDDPASRWGVIVWDQPDTELGDWVDVTCEIPGEVTFNAGSDESRSVIVAWEAATCSFQLDGPGWDPWSGPYAGALGPQTPVRWRWKSPDNGVDDWQPLFYGAVQDGGYQWDPMTQRASLACTDPTADLAAFEGEEQTAQGAGETSSARVIRILNTAQWPEELRDVTAGGVELVSTNLSGTALSQLQDVAQTDLALMWVRRDGRLAYRPQGRANPAPVDGRLVVCWEEDGDLQVITMERADFSPVANRIAVRPGKPADAEGDDPPYVVVEDTASVARYRARQLKYDLLHDATIRPGWSNTVAQLLLAGQAWPSMAPHLATLGLASDDPLVPLILFSLEPDTTFEVVDKMGRVWVCAVAGWEVVVSFSSCVGTLQLTDVTGTVGSQWDSAGWDVDRWGLGMVS